MTKHTPGPWTAIEGDVFNPNRTWGVSKFLSLLECQEIDGDDAEENSRTTIIAEVTAGPTDAADAKLMAAAPELLAVAERVASLNENHAGIGPGMLLTLVTEARAAIAKATT